jgi:hypothetical protein
MSVVRAGLASRMGHHAGRVAHAVGRLPYGAELDSGGLGVFGIEPSSPVFILAFMFGVFLLAGGWALFSSPGDGGQLTQVRVPSPWPLGPIGFDQRVHGAVDTSSVGHRAKGPHDPLEAEP